LTRHHLAAGSIADGDDPIHLTPDDAGWTSSGLRVLDLAAGESRLFETGDTEVFVLPLSATGVTVSADGQTFLLEGRTSVFARVSDFVYVGRDAAVTVTSASGGEIAVPSARCERALPPRYGSAADVAVEVRGAGQATRSISNFASPESWSHADKLMCVEVDTPDGNWSSSPPHQHDDSPECPVNNEEIYYFRIGRAGSTGYAPDGFGMHRTYTGERPDLDPSPWVDDHMAVHDGDVYVIPRGYHGPCIAAPGSSMYYLNVLSGPGGERSMAFCDDPTHHWIRDEWAGMVPDPRCPLVTADGPSFPS
jgi:5-deoxy-glucuronate isomerase